MCILKCRTSIITIKNNSCKICGTCKLQDVMWIMGGADNCHLFLNNNFFFFIFLFRSFFCCWLLLFLVFFAHRLMSLVFFPFWVSVIESATNDNKKEIEMRINKTHAKRAQNIHSEEGGLPAAMYDFCVFLCAILVFVIVLPFLFFTNVKYFDDVK